MKSVIVTWTTENRIVPRPVHHFHVELAMQQRDVAVTETSVQFDNVEPGTMSGHVVSCDAAGVELAPPIMFEVEVPQDITGPIVVGASGTVA